MSTRTSIEVHPTGCRLVEVQAPSGRRSSTGDVVVRRFVASVPASTDPAAMSAALGALRVEGKLARPASVILWGLRATQHFLRLPPAKPADLPAIAAREARTEIAALETDGERATVATMVGREVTIGTHRKREVSIVAAAAGEVKRRIQPVLDAGFDVDRVSTPAMALAAVAWSRRDSTPGTTAIYVALTARATCAAIVRDGVLLFAREMAWGHESPLASPDEPLSARLTSELRRSILFFKQTFRTPVEMVVLCGDPPALRDLAAPLTGALEMPVQTLDSLVGIDATALPEPAAQFRSGVAALRLAIAVGADGDTAANLLPAGVRQTRQQRAQTVRLIGSIAASVLLVALWYGAVQRTSSSRQSEKRALEQQIAMLEPQAARAADQRGAYELGRARTAAISALSSQGPRLARFLEQISRSITDDVVLNSIAIQADGAHWNATMTGVATKDDAASGQAAVNSLLRGLSDSPFAGAPVQPPSLRVVSGMGAMTAGTSGGTAVAPVPDGKSGVEFTLRLRLPK